MRHSVLVPTVRTAASATDSIWFRTDALLLTRVQLEPHHVFEVTWKISDEPDDEGFLGLCACHLNCLLLQLVLELDYGVLGLWANALELFDRLLKVEISGIRLQEELHGMRPGCETSLHAGVVLNRTE